MSKNIFVRQGPVRRSAALLSAATLATSALIATAGSAGAALTAGPNDDTTGVAEYYADDEGLALKLCEGAEPFCEPADPVDTEHIGVYFSAEAQAGPVSAGFGLEAVRDELGQPFVSNGARFRAEDLTANATYTIRTPWGRHLCPTDGLGELDCRVESGGEEGTEFEGPVQSFLRSTTATDGGFIGNHELFSAVTGSPTGFNRVSVSGPGVNASTDQFSLMGQLAENRAMTSLSARSLDMGTRDAAFTQQITYTNFGTADATPTVAVSGANPRRFSVVQSQTTVAPDSASQISVTYRPRPNRAHSAILTISDNSLAAPRQVALSGQGVDTLRPRLSSRNPAPRSRVGRARNVRVGFNEAVRGVRRATFTLVESRTGDRVRASVRRVRQSNRYVLNPRRALDRRTGYRVRLDGGPAGIRDLSGNASRDISWRFRTR